ncbi:PRC-barrel domain-containing protein [Pedobacter sp. SYSU D00535]|uniref:PRC-barrel domain-containing protein n=1 Tax=Pedobacter sp. SYSU D00535 TaxID=2810308 RepID=UPI001A966249|nr:PRC-barrel domain-containing protein [Pedobacter sp. SYSU D00535]
MSSNNSYETHLEELGKSKYEIASGESDIRGWTVKNEYGKILGTINDLIFDTKAKKVKYLILDLDGNELYLQQRKVLLPLHLADLDEVHRNAIFPGQMTAELTSIPSYEKGKITSRMEEIVSTAFAGRHRGDAETRSFSDRLAEAPTYPSGTVERDERTRLSDERDHRRTEGYPNEDMRGSLPDQAQHTSSTGDSGSIRSYTNAGAAYMAGRDTNSLNAGRQTVVGIFDHTNQAQSAVEHLVKNGVRRESIDISYRNETHQENNSEHDSSVTNFFKSLFSDDDEAKGYTDAARQGSVVTVHATSRQEAEFVAEIMDNYGAVNMEDRIRSSRSNLSNTAPRRYRSRIIDHGDNDERKWL